MNAILSCLLKKAEYIQCVMELDTLPKFNRMHDNTLDSIYADILDLYLIIGFIFSMLSICWVDLYGDISVGFKILMAFTAYFSVILLCCSWKKGLFCQFLVEQRENDFVRIKIHQTSTIGGYQICFLYPVQFIVLHYDYITLVVKVNAELFS